MRGVHVLCACIASTCDCDECGFCDADAANDCTQDCAGVWGGSAAHDECFECDLDPANNCAQVNQPPMLIRIYTP